MHEGEQDKREQVWFALDSLAHMFHMQVLSCSVISEMQGKRYKIEPCDPVFSPKFVHSENLIYRIVLFTCPPRSGYMNQ